MSTIRIQNVNKFYGPLQVLKNVDLAIGSGEFTVLLGPSGCGKSTLLSAIAGLEEIQEGGIELGGRDVTHVEPAKRDIAMVFQSYALYPTMTVAGNMSFGLRVNRTPKAEIDERVGWAARLLQIENLLDRKPSQLSGGQRQRVAIGRALVRKTPVYLFDEPLSNLDAKLRTEMRVEIKRLHQTLGATMIYVTHDQIEAMTLATHIALMRAGVVEQFGHPEDLYQRPASLFVAGFIGSPSMNFLPGTLAPNGAGVGLELPGLGGGQQAVDVASYAFATPAKAGEITVGLRPEDIELVNDGPALEGKTLFVEPMGADSLAWFDVAGHRVSVRLKADDGKRVGETARLAVPTEKLSLFDPNTENRV